MIRKLKDRFKRSSDSTAVGLIAAAVEEPKKMTGVPRYARYRHRHSNQPPLYDTTGEFLDLNPLADIPVGSLARPEGGQESPTWGVDDWLDGQYEPFPWNPDETESDVIINEERL